MFANLLALSGASESSPWIELSAIESIDKSLASCKNYSVVDSSYSVDSSFIACLNYGLIRLLKLFNPFFS